MSLAGSPVCYSLLGFVIYYKVLHCDLIDKDPKSSQKCWEWNGPDVCFRLNSHVVRFLERRKKNSSALRNGAANNAELDDGCDATAVLLKKGKLFVQLGFNSWAPRILGNKCFYNYSVIACKVCLIERKVAAYVESMISDFHCMIIVARRCHHDDIVVLQLKDVSL